MIASKLAKGLVYGARAGLRDTETTLLKSAGWSPKKSVYDGVTYWYHPDVGVISKATAAGIAMGECESS